MMSVMAQFERPLVREHATMMALLPQVLVRGTKKHPAPEKLMRAFDDLYGASLSSRVNKHGDRQTVEFSVQVPAEQYVNEDGLFEQAIGLLSDVMYEPKAEGESFLAPDVETEKRLLSQRIENTMNDKIAYALWRCIQIMCEGEAFGVPRLGYAEDVPAITASALYEAYRSFVTESPLHIYIVGPVPSDAADRVATVFAKRGLNGSRVEASESVEADVRAVAASHRKAHGTIASAAREPRVVVEELDVNQGKLDMGLRTGISYADDDYPALIVYNGILGGFVHSKLFANVREKSSLAYYASSRLEGLKGLLFVQSGIQIDNFARTRDIIEVQLKALRDGDISDDELEFTRMALANQYLQSDDQPLTGAVMHMYGRYSGRMRTVAELLEQVQAVTKEDVVRIASSISVDTVYFLRDKEAHHEAN